MLSTVAEGVLECNGGFNQSKLFDGNTGPVNSISDDLGSFFAFNNSTSEIEYTFNATTSSVAMTLYFFNFPSKSIGFPSLLISTINKIPIPFTYALNSDLSQSDSTIRSVTVELQPMTPVNFVRVNFEFNNDSIIDWFLLSEVEITAGILKYIHTSTC